MKKRVKCEQIVNDEFVNYSVTSVSRFLKVEYILSLQCLHLVNQKYYHKNNEIVCDVFHCKRIDINKCLLYASQGYNDRVFKRATKCGIIHYIRYFLITKTRLMYLETIK